MKGGCNDKDTYFLMIAHRDIDSTQPTITDYLSANTILVLVTFSMVNFVLPPLPAILPIARDK